MYDILPAFFNRLVEISGVLFDMTHEVYEVYSLCIMKPERRYVILHDDLHVEACYMDIEELKVKLFKFFGGEIRSGSRELGGNSAHLELSLTE